MFSVTRYPSKVYFVYGIFALGVLQLRDVMGWGYYDGFFHELVVNIFLIVIGFAVYIYWKSTGEGSEVSRYSSN